ncbi:MAG: Ca-activated chloride channel family protein [Candidatus Omnitrophota bacterium]|jgi:Ca-activated chloride channel family protein
MRFANPAFFLLAIPILIILWLYVRGVLGRDAALKFSNVDMVRSAGVRNLSFSRVLQALLRLVVLILLMIALARPQTGEGVSEELKDVVDVMIAVDISSSMATLDFHPDNRLMAAKLEAQRFIQSRPMDRIGLVAFAKHSFTVSPLTTDHAALQTLLNTIQMGMIEDGTAIGVGLANAINRIRESEAASKVVILLTDGVNNSGEIDPITAGNIAKELGVRVYTIGMGKDGQAMIPVNDPRFGRRLIQTYTEIDETTLQTISKQTGGSYFRAQDEVALRRIFLEIDRLERTEIKIESYTNYREHYAYILNLALIALLIDLLITQFVWRKIP